MNDQAHRLRIDISLARGDFMLRVDLSLPARGITVLFGPSGSGKTSILRCVAGLEQACGRIALGTDIWQDSRQQIFKPTWRREIGYVFQEASLFEHLDVRQNLLFGLRRTGRAADIRSLDDALRLLGIGHLLERAVATLSGGERQRVAIARALATDPKLLLLDEPLASLDVVRRNDVLPWLEHVRESLRTPMLYVTHSVDELVRLADHVVMLDHGSVRSSGPAAEVLASPGINSGFGEDASLLAHCEVIERQERASIARVRFGGGTLWVADHGLAVGQTARIRIRARDISLALSPHADSTIDNQLPGRIESIDADAGRAEAVVAVRCGSERLIVRTPHRSVQRLKLAPGLALWCQIRRIELIAPGPSSSPEGVAPR